MNEGYGNTFGALTRETHEMFDDFDMKVMDVTNENWILNAGTDPQALDPVVVIAEEGTIFCDAGDGDGTDTEDASQIVWAIPVQADSGGLEFGGRLYLQDITGCSVNIGLTDTTSLEEPFSIASAAITAVANNAVCFTFDDGATVKEWFALGVDATTKSTGNGATGVAPVNGEYQTFKCKIDAGGEDATFFINDALVGTLTANVVLITQNLYLTAVIVGDGGNSSAVGLTVDYLYVKHTR